MTSLKINTFPGVEHYSAVGGVVTIYMIYVALKQQWTTLCPVIR